MSQFHFLQHEWPAVFDAAARTEGMVRTDPRIALFHAARIEEIEALCPEVNLRSLQRDLHGLVEKGVVKAEGSARAARYVLSGGAGHD